jgi:anti-sigma B factor antagonist
LLTLSVEIPDERTSVIALGGELELSTIPMVESRLLAEVRARSAIVIDLTRVSFIDSSGIGILIGAFRTANDGKRLHAVAAPGSQVERVLRLVGLDRVLPMFADRTNAFEALNGGQRA